MSCIPALCMSLRVTTSVLSFDRKVFIRVTFMYELGSPHRNVLLMLRTSSSVWEHSVPGLVEFVSRRRSTTRMLNRVSQFPVATRHVQLVPVVIGLGLNCRNTSLAPIVDIEHICTVLDAEISERTYVLNLNILYNTSSASSPSLELTALSSTLTFSFFRS